MITVVELLMTTVQIVQSHGEFVVAQKQNHLVKLEMPSLERQNAKATQAEIKKAYRRKAREAHPDIGNIHRGKK